MHREKHEKTDEAISKVMCLAAIGKPMHEIADAICVDVNTLQTYYKEEIKRGKSYVAGVAMGALYQKIVEGDARMIEFYCKTQLGFSETKKVVLSTPAALMVVMESVLKSLPNEYHDRVKLAAMTALNDVAAAESAALPEPSELLAEYEVRG